MALHVHRAPVLTAALHSRRQALLFRRGSLSVLQQTRLFFEHTKRLSD